MIGGSDVAWVEEQRGVLNRRDEGKKRFFLFSGMVGLWKQKRDGFSIDFISDLGKRRERERIK